MDQKTTEPKVSVEASDHRMPICASCGATMTYEGPKGENANESDHHGGSYVCPNGHIEAVDPND